MKKHWHNDDIISLIDDVTSDENDELGDAATTVEINDDGAHNDIDSNDVHVDFFNKHKNYVVSI